MGVFVPVARPDFFIVVMSAVMMIMLVTIFMIMFMAIRSIAIMRQSFFIVMRMILRIRQSLHSETVHVDIFCTEITGSAKTGESH